MKKIILYISVFVSPLLMGSCVPTESTVPQCEENETYNEVSEQCEIVEGETPYMYESAEKEVVDLMYYYSLGDKPIQTYRNDDDDYSYINMAEFMTQTSKLTLDVRFEEEDTFSVRFVDKLHPYLANLYKRTEFDYHIIFDPQQNTISISDMNVFSAINAPIESPSSELLLSDLTYTGVAAVTVVDLDDYNMRVIEQDGSFYLPLFLTNLFLIGDLVNIYETDDSIILFDVGSDFDQIDTRVEGNSINDLNILETSENYLKLVFDYFYGLDEVTGLDYDGLIDSYNFNEQVNFEDYYTQLDTYLTSLDDLHTRLIYPGFNAPGYEKVVEYPTDSRGEAVETALDTYSCSDYTEDYYITNVGSTHYAIVNGFSEFTGALAHQLHLADDEIDTLIIDLRCNTGGNLAGVLELLTIVTDQPIPLNFYNPQTGIYEQQVIENYTKRALDAEIYVLISEVTFSGGNLFASIVKDLDAAPIIGTKSTGGACAIELTVLPDGSIIVFSSNFLLRNTSDENIEYGIEPDYSYEDDFLEIDPSAYEDLFGDEE